MISTISAASGQATLVATLRPWRRQLVIEALERWFVRGAIASLGVASAVLLVGWFVPRPESELRPLALELAALPVLAAVLVALVPRSHRHTTSELDQRLRTGDRIATAWAYRASDAPIAVLQREDALRHVPAIRRSVWRPTRPELAVLGAAALVTLLLMLTPSPQQSVLDRQAAEEQSVQQANQQLDALRSAAIASQALTPDQARQLDELLRQAQADLQQTHAQAAASTVLAHAQNDVAQLGDPNADLRDEALASMSETLAAEPQTRALAGALQQEDPHATSKALSDIRDLAAQSDKLADVERQALSRALQRAANVGRGDPQSASALSAAAQAIASGQPADQALAQANAALRDALQASQAQSELNATVQQLRDLQAQVASGNSLNSKSNAKPDVPSQATQGVDSSGLPDGTPIALDPSRAQSVRDPSATSRSTSAQGAGVDPASATAAREAASASSVAPSENVFVPGRPGAGAADQQDLVDQQFNVRGAPRPYRDVLSQYAQSSRDYVDRPDISPAVRDLVKQYFQELEQGE